jgi:single-stranded DNA-binding protein
MKNLNLIGRLGADATVKEISEGKHVMEMNVFVNGTKKDSPAQVVKVVQFGNKPFTNSHLFKKGNLVSASGNNEVEAYLSKDGVAKASEVLYASYLHLESMADGNKEQAAAE